MEVTKSIATMVAGLGSVFETVMFLAVVFVLMEKAVGTKVRYSVLFVFLSFGYFLAWFWHRYNHFIS